MCRKIDANLIEKKKLMGCVVVVVVVSAIAVARRPVAGYTGPVLLLVVVYV